jgi:hypothetical protein
LGNFLGLKTKTKEKEKEQRANKKVRRRETKQRNKKTSRKNVKKRGPFSDGYRFGYPYLRWTCEVSGRGSLRSEGGSNNDKRRRKGPL